MERKLAAILSADVQGYSRLMGDDEEATIRTLTVYREAMSCLIEQHRGRVVDSPGDNLLAEFASAVDAVQGAVAIQKELKTQNTELPVNRQMHYRIGINVGDIVTEGERIYGDGVNIAARLESLAEGGGICISGNVYEQVENKLALRYAYQGEQTVKNIAKPVRVYRVDVNIEVPAPTVSQEQTPVLSLPDKPSIAILPFANMSGDPEQEYFSDGITEDIITDLSQIAGLFVIARQSVLTYKGKAAKVQVVSRELGVRYVLEGSVRKAGNRVRITAQLIDATTGGHLWAQRYDRPLDDVFALQDEVTQKIVSALEVELTEGEQARLVYKETDNLEAYEAFWQAEAYLWRFTKETNLEAQQLYQRAVELDPQYASAQAGLAHAYGLAWEFGWSEDPQMMERAVELAHKALALDASQATAHHVLAGDSWFKGQYDQAISHLEHSVSLDPNDAYGYTCLGHVLAYAGRPEEAIRELEKAVRLSPRYPPHYLFILGEAYSFAGRYEEALTIQKRVLARWPDFWLSHLSLAIIYGELDRPAEARAALAEARRINPQLSLEAFANRKHLYKDPALFERELAALHSAGLE